MFCRPLEYKSCEDSFASSEETSDAIVLAVTGFAQEFGNGLTEA
jgi:hypothetical protein